MDGKFLSCDGHDINAVSAAITAAKTDPRPSMICCKTIIGYGAPNKQGTSGVHGSPLGDAEIALVRAALDWPHPAFEIPAGILKAWRAVGSKVPMSAKHGRSDTAKARMLKLSLLLSIVTSTSPLRAPFWRGKSNWPANQKNRLAVASQKVIEAVLPACPTLFGGSADLTGSNNTRVADHSIFSHTNYDGTYIHYGVREHGMAAAMNGIALHGGAIPYGGTFLVFTDYCRPSIRLSALMEQRVIYVMTHDSIGLGEDGPTHQPVEHLAALRAIPNLFVFRPGDSVETAEAWQTALEAKSTPSILALSRQALTQFRSGDMRENKTAKGGYVATDCDGERQITLIASGSEVGIAITAQALLADAGISAAVVSVPCLDLFFYARRQLS